MAKRYFWLKFQTDFFRLPVVKKMRKMAGGDTFTIIYLKLQLLSVPEGGLIKLTGVEDDYAAELALILDEEKDNVQVTCMYLLKYGLLEILDDRTLLLPSAAENIGSETDSARRMRKLRDKQTAALPTSDTLRCKSNETSQCDIVSLQTPQSDAAKTVVSQCDADVTLSQSDAIMSQSDAKTSRNDAFCYKNNLPSQCDGREDKSRLDIDTDTEKKKSAVPASFDFENDEKDFYTFLVSTVFEKLFARKPNKSFMTSVQKLFANGLQVGDAQDTILQAAKQQPRHPEPYILKILQAKSSPAQDPNRPLDRWEQEMIDRVTQSKALQSNADNL